MYRRHFKLLNLRYQTKSFAAYVMDIERGRRLWWSDLLITTRQFKGDRINTRLKKLSSNGNTHTQMEYFQTTFRFWQWINCHLFPLKRKSCGWHIKFNWITLNVINLNLIELNSIYLHYEPWTVRWTKVKQANYTDPGHLASNWKQIGFHN